MGWVIKSVNFNKQLAKCQKKVQDTFYKFTLPEISLVLLNLQTSDFVHELIMSNISFLIPAENENDIGAFFTRKTTLVEIEF